MLGRYYEYGPPAALCLGTPLHIHKEREKEIKQEKKIVKKKFNFIEFVPEIIILFYTLLSLFQQMDTISNSIFSNTFKF